MDARRGKELFLTWIIIGKKLMIPPPARLTLPSLCVSCHLLVKWKVMACTVGHKYGRGRGGLEQLNGAGGTLDSPSP